MGTVSKKCAFDARKISGIYIDTRGRGPVEIKDLISARRNALKNGKKTAQILKGSGGGGATKGWVHSFLAAESRKQGFGKLTCSHSSRGSAKTIQHYSHANKATKLSILLRFYFHGVLEQLKTNFQTNFRFKRVLTWRPRELSCRFKKWLISGNFAI